MWRILPAVGSMALGAMAGLATEVILRAGRVAPWQVSVSAPLVGERSVRAVELVGIMVAAVVAVCVLLSWFAAMTAAGQRRWRESGGVAVQGGTAKHPDLTAATVEKNRRRLDEAEARCEQLEAENAALMERVDGLSENMIRAAAAAGAYLPPLPPGGSRSRDAQVIQFHPKAG